MPVTAMLIGGGLGLAKNQLVDVPQQQRQLKLAAETEAMSPWTGEKAKPVAQPNAFTSAMQGAAGGAAMGQGMNQADLQKAMAARLNTGGSLGGYGGGGYGSDLADPNSPWLIAGGKPQYTGSAMNFSGSNV